jgi:hypothetical protein
MLLGPSFTIWKLCAHVLWTELHVCGCTWALSHECISLSHKYSTWSSVAKLKSIQAGRTTLFEVCDPIVGTSNSRDIDGCKISSWIFSLASNWKSWSFHFKFRNWSWDAKPRRGQGEDHPTFPLKWSHKPTLGGCTVYYIWEPRAFMTPP